MAADPSGLTYSACTSLFGFLVAEDLIEGNTMVGVQVAAARPRMRIKERPAGAREDGWTGSRSSSLTGTGWSRRFESPGSRPDALPG